MDNKIIDLAKKLNELAKRGEGGEKQNARLKLDALMIKHGLTIEQLEGLEIKRRKFFIDSDTEQTIFLQTVSKVLNKNDNRIYTPRDARTKRFIMVDVTDIQYIDIDAHFTFYKALYEKEQKMFLQAFIQAQKLFSNIQNGTVKPLTNEERAEQMRMLSMSQSITKATFNKQLNAV